MWEKFKLILRDTDLRRKFLYLLGFLAVFRLISSIPIPGIDALRLRQFFEANQFFGRRPGKSFHYDAGSRSLYHWLHYHAAFNNDFPAAERIAAGRRRSRQTKI